MSKSSSFTPLYNNSLVLSDNADENNGIVLPYQADQIFFSSDEHITHANILKYTYRDYPDIETMAKDYIARHNAVVPAKDSVWIDLGDFVFSMRWRKANSKYDVLKSCVHRMNGNIKILVCGNHDHMKLEEYESAGFDKVFARGAMLTLKLPNGRSFTVSHKPPQLAPNKDEQEPGNDGHESKNQFLLLDIQNKDQVPEENFKINKKWLCGHVHQIFRHYAKGPILNVGVDVWDGYPVSLATLLKEFEK